MSYGILRLRRSVLVAFGGCALALLTASGARAGCSGYALVAPACSDGCTGDDSGVDEGAANPDPTIDLFMYTLSYYDQDGQQQTYSNYFATVNGDGNVLSWGGLVEAEKELTDKGYQCWPSDGESVAPADVSGLTVAPPELPSIAAQANVPPKEPTPNPSTPIDIGPI